MKLSIDGPFAQSISKLGDIWIVSFMWLVFSIPVVTIGASTTALVDVTIKMARNHEGHVWKDFFKSFCANFKKATVLFLISLLFFAIVLADIWFWARIEGTLGFVLYALSIGIGFLGLMAEIYIFPLVANFENKVFITIKNAFLFAVKHFLRSAIIVLILLVIAVLSYYFLAVLFLVLFFGTGIIAYTLAPSFNKVFKEYRNDREDEVDEPAESRIIK